MRSTSAMPLGSTLSVLNVGLSTLFFFVLSISAWGSIVAWDFSLVEHRILCTPLYIRVSVYFNLCKSSVSCVATAILTF